MDHITQNTNQYFLCDQERDHQYGGTIKCAICTESQSFPKPPIKRKRLNDFLRNFMYDHTKKGCNAIQLPKSPHWAAMMDVKDPKVFK